MSMSVSVTATTWTKRALVDITPNGGSPSNLALEDALMVGLGNGDAGPEALEPPPKRPRLEKDVDARRKSLKERLAKQVLPHVKEAVKDLPADLYKVNDIAVKVSCVCYIGLLFSSRPYKADLGFCFQGCNATG